jgi:hypothetical protein
MRIGKEISTAFFTSEGSVYLGSQRLKEEEEGGRRREEKERRKVR